MIAIACDHAGIDLKPHVIAVLDELGIPYKDLGTNSHESVDYPIYGARAANAVASGECSMGIIMCGTGVGIGMAASMGAFLLMAGQKGKRLALPNSEIMIHQPLGGASGQATDVAIRAEWLVKTKEKMTRLMSEMTGQPIERVKQDVERDYFMSAEEGLKYGIIDEIYRPRNAK